MSFERYPPPQIGEYDPPPPSWTRDLTPSTADALLDERSIEAW